MLSKKLNIKNKIHYLSLVFIPIAFFILYQKDKTVSVNNNTFQIFTSIKSTKNSAISLYKDSLLLQTWGTSNEAYKQIDLTGPLFPNEKANLFFKLNNAIAGDTISFLAINIVLNNKVYTLGEDQFDHIRVSANAKKIIRNNQLQVVLYKTNINTIIYLENPSTWETENLTLYKVTFIVLLLSTFLLLTIIIRPTYKSLYWTIGTTVFSLLIFKYLGKEIDVSLNINNDNAIKGLTIFYNDNSPTFDESRSKNINEINKNFEGQIEDNNSSYFRIDFPNSGANLSNFNIKYNLGILSKKWMLDEVKPCYLIGNNVDLIGNKLYIKGQDSYITIGSIYFINSIQINCFIRKTIWLFFGLLVFAFCLILFKKTPQLKVQDFILFVFFVITILSQLLYFIVNGHRSVLESEKRLTTSFPKKDTISIRKYTIQLENYFNDQLQGQNKFTHLNNKLRYSLFSELSTSKLVHFGENGWLFDISGTSKVVYENKNPYTINELKRITSLLQNRSNWLKKLGIKYYVVFPEMPHQFYNEYIGKKLIKYNPESQLNQVIKYLKVNSDISIIDINTSMQLAKKTSNKELYYKVDSHWNYYGAFIAYKAIIKHIQKDFKNLKNSIPENEINWNVLYNEEGDLARLVSLDHSLLRKDYFPSNIKINTAKKIINKNTVGYIMSGPILTYESSDSLAPTMLMFRDSYANNLIPYFSWQFSRHTYVWSTLFYPKIILSEKPDIVITEMMESTISELLKENPKLTEIEK